MNPTLKDEKKKTKMAALVAALLTLNGAGVAAVGLGASAIVLVTAAPASAAPLSAVHPVVADLNGEVNNSITTWVPFVINMILIGLGLAAIIGIGYAIHHRRNG
jgi:hypothetical protein